MTFLQTLLEILAIGAIVVFGAFVLVLVADLILASIDNRQGIFFNRNRKDDSEVKYYSQEPVVPEEPKEVEQKQEEITAVDFDKAVEEQKALENKFVPEPVEEEEPEEDIDGIIETVRAQALRELEADQKDKVVFTMPEPEPVEEKTDEEKLALEQKVKELEELREKDRAELLELMQKETVVTDTEDDRKYANIARMNAKLNSIKRNTNKLKDTKKKEPKTEVVVIDERPKFKKEYYENRLEILQQDLADAQKDLRTNNKEYMPIYRVKKAYERDISKLRRKEAIVAKQKLSIYGVNKKGDVDEKKKERLEQNIAELKPLKESVFNCEQVINENTERFPALEKNHKLLQKQIKRLIDDITSVKTALAWFEQNDNGNK